MKRNIKDYFLITLKGIAMGAADVVPGVSGGTIAFITGIYEELIDTINKIDFNAFGSSFSILCRSASIKIDFRYFFLPK